jgi:hypothetical protein
MYLIDRLQKKMAVIEPVTFSSQGLSERADLQEWLVANPIALGEPLLIIQKEFDGFDGTYERLDLLALDKEFNLVVIENKLDDSGRDVTWQALKYASYCASLSTQDIIRLYQSYLDKYQMGDKAEEKLIEFFEGAAYEGLLNQAANGIRIILVAARFRKEVTSTVLWLLNYNVRLQCHQVTLYKLDEQLLLNVEQIIPLRETQEYTVRMAVKAQEEAQTKAAEVHRYELRRKFWQQLLPLINQKTDLFSGINPTRDHWLSAGSGVRACPYSFVVTYSSASVLLNLSRPERWENVWLFEKLFAQRTQIEQDFGAPLNWDIKDGRISVKIEHRKEDVNYFEQDQWPVIMKFLADAMTRLEAAFKKPLSAANTALANASPEVALADAGMDEALQPEPILSFSPAGL